MLRFIQGVGTSEYLELLALNESYKSDLYLDTEGNRLYLGGKALDVRVVVDDVIDEYYQHKRSYRFIGPDEEVTIADALIPTINDYTINLHNVETGQEAEYGNGLMSFRDKFVLDTICKLLGIEIEYTYWATVHHYSDVLNGDFETLTQVEVFKNQDDEWTYNYDEFSWSFRPTSSDEITQTFTVPAGQMTLQNDGSYTTPTKVYSRNGQEIILDPNQYTIPGEIYDEIATVRAKSLKMIRKAKDFSFFDGGDRPADQAMLYKHGGIPAGTTVADLEKLTVSEVLARILFQTGTLKKVCDTRCYIKFGDEYIDHWGVETEDGIQYIEIGARYPTYRDFKVVFQPETWILEVDGHQYGEPQYLTEMTEAHFWINDEQHPWTPGHGPAPEGLNIYDLEELEREGYHEHFEDWQVTAGDKSVYFGKIKYRAIANAHDQFGNETYIDEHGEEQYYSKPEDGEIQSYNYLCFTGVEHTTNPTFDNDKVVVLPFNQEWPTGDEPEDSIFLTYSLTASLRIFSNATESSKTSPWKKRNEEPGAYTSNVAFVEADGMAVPGQCLFFRWPSMTAASEHFYIYIPEDYTVSEIGGAHDGADDEWSVRMTATPVYLPNGEPDITEIPNRFEVVARYQKYEISKCDGITNARIRFAVKD